MVIRFLLVFVIVDNKSVRKSVYFREWEFYYMLGINYDNYLRIKYILVSGFEF